MCSTLWLLWNLADYDAPYGWSNKNVTYIHDFVLASYGHIENILLKSFFWEIASEIGIERFEKELHLKEIEKSNRNFINSNWKELERNWNLMNGIDPSSA